NGDIDQDRDTNEHSPSLGRQWTLCSIGYFGRLGPGDVASRGLDLDEEHLDRRYHQGSVWACSVLVSRSQTTISGTDDSRSTGSVLDERSGSHWTPHPKRLATSISE